MSLQPRAANAGRPSGPSACRVRPVARQAWPSQPHRPDPGRLHALHVAAGGSGPDDHVDRTNGGNWEAAGNWSAGVPQLLDAAIITPPTRPTSGVAINAATTVAGLALSNTNLRVMADLTVTGATYWEEAFCNVGHGAERTLSQATPKAAFSLKRRIQS